MLAGGCNYFLLNNEQQNTKSLVQLLLIFCDQFVLYLFFVIVQLVFDTKCVCKMVLFMIEFF